MTVYADNSYRMPTRHNKEMPLLLFVCSIVEGHVNPFLIIAKHLVSRGYEVAMLCTPPFKDRLEGTGIEYIPYKFDFQFLGPKHIRPELTHLPSGHLDHRLGEWERSFLGSMSWRLKLLVGTLEMLRERDQDRQIIVMDDCINTAALPLVYGAPLPDGFDRRPKLIGISSGCLAVRSRDTAPFFLGLPPDSSESGRLRNDMLYRLMKEGPMKPIYETFKAAMEECGCTSIPTGEPFTLQYISYDMTLQLCSPSMEYHRSDLPASIHLVGTLPSQEIPRTFKYPGWWSEVSENKDKKKIVFVTQGSINLDHTQLVKPTLNALSDRPDILVIVTLGLHGVALDATIPVPSNARVIDYLPYRAIMPHTDVLVANAGYGALTSATMHGVPVVFSGESQEKAENARRVQVIGMGLNLYSQTPKAKHVREAVDEVLRNPSYKRRAMELKAENERMDSLQNIERLVESMIE